MKEHGSTFQNQEPLRRWRQLMQCSDSVFFEELRLSDDASRDVLLRLEIDFQRIVQGRSLGHDTAEVRG